MRIHRPQWEVRRGGRIRGDRGEHVLGASFLACFALVAIQLLYAIVNTATDFRRNATRFTEPWQRRRRQEASHPVIASRGVPDPPPHGGGRGVQRPMRLPLRQLVNSDIKIRCPDGLLRVNDTVLDPNLAYDLGRRKIPRVIHVTSKTRCMPREFVDNLSKWPERLDGHSFFLHDDTAVDRLLHGRDWSREFPQLAQALHCTKGGAGKADVWRALVLWEYGGVYTDIDNAPTARFDASTIHRDDDAFFVKERSGILSQYFMATTPRHPLIYLLVHHMMNKLLALNDVGSQTVSVVTGPGALRHAFCGFVGGQGANHKPYTWPKDWCWNPESKLWRGLDNYTVRLAGSEDDPDDLVARDIIPDKNEIYKRMNMTYFRDLPKHGPIAESCFQRLYRRLGQGRDDASTAFLSALATTAEPRRQARREALTIDY